MDAIQEWLEERCVADPKAVTSFKDLYEDYSVWCTENEQEPLTKRAFGNRLTEKGFTTTKITRSVKGRRGLRLRQGDPEGDRGDSRAEVLINFQRLSSYGENIESSAHRSPIGLPSASNRENNDFDNDTQF